MPQQQPRVSTPAPAVANLAVHDDVTSAMRVSPPWTWAVLTVFAALLATAILFCVFARVEVTDRARGIVRPVSGVRPLVAQADAVVAEVLVRSGDTVAAGAALARLQSAETDASMLETVRELEQQKTERRRIENDPQFLRQRSALATRLGYLRQQNSSLEQSIVRHRRQLEGVDQLASAGLVSQVQADDAREAYQQTIRNLQAGQEAVSRTEQELAAIEAAQQREVWEADRRIADAEARRDALSFPMQRAVVTAPVDGVVEAVLLRRGDFVRSGQLVGKLLPSSNVNQVVCFVPERDRAFVRVGDVAAIELDQFPYTEFGTLRARVTRASSDLASPHEVQEAMGEGAKLDGPAYRVELQVIDAPKGAVRVRPGMLLHARLTLRRQRLVSMIFQPLARWGDAQ